MEGVKGGKKARKIEGVRIQMERGEGSGATQYGISNFDQHLGKERRDVEKKNMEGKEEMQEICIEMACVGQYISPPQKKDVEKR